MLSWLTGYFEWDPDANFESVRKGLFDAYYRVASAEMTSYHLLLEKALYDTGRCMPYGSDSQMVRQAATGTVIAEAEALLARAETKAAADPVLRKRIDLYLPSLLLPQSTTCLSSLPQQPLLACCQGNHLLGNEPARS